MSRILVISLTSMLFDRLPEKIPADRSVFRHGGSSNP
jgi:hypothetical protein